MSFNVNDKNTSVRWTLPGRASFEGPSERLVLPEVEKKCNWNTSVRWTLPGRASFEGAPERIVLPEVKYLKTFKWVRSSVMAKGILLEAGTNEMEMIEFRLHDTRFGINVAKVREITQKIDTVLIPHSPPSIEGSFMLRDRVLTLINLGQYFNMEGDEISRGDGLIVIVEFNHVHCGILVDAVEQIHRLSWNQIEQPSEYLTHLNIPVTGTVNIDDRTILIIDCETIISDILGINFIDDSGPDRETPDNDKESRIIFADDSSVIRKNVLNVLHQGGYHHVTVCSDGAQAWEKLQKNTVANEKQYDLVLTDIEMPGMDGLHLTHKIKQDPKLKEIPVVLFSSLITEDNRKKGESVGANAQVSKTDSSELIKVIAACLSQKGKTENRAEVPCMA